MAVVGAGPALADWENALVGALAGGVTGALTTPFDTGTRSSVPHPPPPHHPHQHQRQHRVRVA
eukprot:116487-Rhodomonas_salina.7